MLVLLVMVLYIVLLDPHVYMFSHLINSGADGKIPWSLFSVKYLNAAFTFRSMLSFSLPFPDVNRFCITFPSEISSSIFPSFHKAECFVGLSMWSLVLLVADTNLGAPLIPLWRNLWMLYFCWTVLTSKLVHQ